ncbi:hypothetical protein [Polaribacter sp. Asnod1-A03]|uniref:hypothetical protein n=1 Tax=Polaribacter sp. Asnod1-A03 TaxID=3160581 RepID=UPI0038701E58
MGQTTLDELKMTVYDKDSTAAAVVLYEHANVYLDPEFDYKTRTDYYYRIKILDKAAFDFADVEIHLYKEKKAIDVKAITYNLSENGGLSKNTINKDQIFKVKDSENWSSTKFTMPNLKEGSVIEYSYSVISPYLGIDDWYFQSSIPKIKSEIDAAVLGNYKYNVRLVGFLQLDKDDPSIKKKCLYIDGIGEGACVIYSYGINNIPAFKEEDYMLSKKNYISRLSFDLKTYTSTRGVVEEYTTTWKQADKQLKDIFLNNQTSKKSFFRKNIPENILNTEDQLTKAKDIYSFIKNHFTWNQKFWNSADEKIKKAFDKKSGSAGEINLSLYNSLKAADIDANLVILSTRDNGIPTKLFPVIFDFNYVIVQVVINGTEYFLDATNKYLPFGQIPSRCINGQARLINSKKENNWITLKPKIETSKKMNAIFSLNDEGNFEGSLLIRRQGYEALNQREKINTLTENAYLESFETDYSDAEVDDYKVKKLNQLEQPIEEVFDLKIISGNDLSNKIRINPFFFDRIKENPFKLKERNYPVDFAYARSNSFNLSLSFPENYKVVQIPESKAFALPENGGVFTIKSIIKEKSVVIYLRFNIKKEIFNPYDYEYLKIFFDKVIKSESSDIVLELKS